MAKNRECPRCKQPTEARDWSGLYETFTRLGEEVDLEVCWMCAKEVTAAARGYTPSYTKVWAA